MKKLFSGSPFLIIFLALMLYNSITSGRFDDPKAWLMDTLMRLPAIVIAITFHEFMHAYSAWKLGDQTPKAQNRVTLNPIAHIDPIGIIALVFVGFGWGKPVQVNPYAFRKNPRRSNIIVDVAGVSMNCLIAFICMPFFILSSNAIVSDILFWTVYFNIVLMVFNLLPVPPLDGFGIVTEVFDLRKFSWYRTFYNSGFFILMFLIFFGIVGRILGPALNFIYNLFYSIWIFIL